MKKISASILAGFSVLTSTDFYLTSMHKTVKYCDTQVIVVKSTILKKQVSNSTIGKSNTYPSFYPFANPSLC
jgi:hypothetical protein